MAPVGGPSRRTVLASGAGVLGALLTGCSSAPGAPAPRPTGTQVLRYGPHPAQFAELTRPDGASRGTVVVLHGGFWLAAYDISLGRPLASDLVRRGWTVLDVEYRRVGDGGGFPATLDDVSAALDLLAADGRTPPDPLVTLGHSAGGQLAVWAAARRRLPRWRSAAVVPTHVVSQAGVLDLRTADAEDLGAGAVRDLLGGSPDEVPDAFAVADPLGQVPLEVPVWCVHGADDGTVPLAQSRVYVDAARAAGAQATLVEVAGDHLDQVDTGSAAWARTLEVLDSVAPRGG